MSILSYAILYWNQTFKTTGKQNVKITRSRHQFQAMSNKVAEIITEYSISWDTKWMLVIGQLAVLRQTFR